ncbi:hypothetical protein KDA82_38160, partial [Streptomyces daliensis]|nr:hypothetical protein [Streptomyces daliensis]
MISTLVTLAASYCDRSRDRQRIPYASARTSNAMDPGLVRSTLRSSRSTRAAKAGRVGEVQIFGAAGFADADG